MDARRIFGAIGISPVRSLATFIYLFILISISQTETSGAPFTNMV